MSSRIAAAIRSYPVPDGAMALFWLGNSAWAVKLDSGKVVYIDPSFSNILESFNGWQRLQRIPLAPSEADCDLVLLTHGHPDHMDPKTIPGLAETTSARFIAPHFYQARLSEMGVPADRYTPLSNGEETEFNGLSIRAVRAFHMHARLEQPHAVGYVLRYKGVSVYHAGDTAYVSEVRDSVKAAGPITVALLPINGKRCCLTTEDAAFLAQDIGARTVVPMHYGMFLENNGDPYELQYFMHRHKVESRLMIVPFLNGFTTTVAGEDRIALKEEETLG